MSWSEAEALAQRLPHTFSIQYPPSREYFRGRFDQPLAPLDLGELREVLVYAHVPFCEARCFYCNFAVDVRKAPEVHERYVRALVVQLGRVDRALAPDCRIPGLDIGGGTPTLLAPPLLERLLEALAPLRARTMGGWAMSIESTPHVAASRPETLALLVRAGVGRVSVGIQSTNDETLAAVNRRAQRSLGDQALTNLLAAGFERVSADLVFGLPGQTLSQWRQDLERVSAQRPHAITTYDCLYRGAGRVLPQLTVSRPTPDTYRALYELAYELLTARGYHAPYGSLNFSRIPGETGTSRYFEARLFDGRPYVGVGNYASSLLGEWWWFAPYDVDAYCAAIDAGQTLPAGDSYRLPAPERMAKYLLLSLNFGRLDRSRFLAAFGVELDALYRPQLERAVDQGWLIETSDGFGVGEGTFGELPRVRALFYPPAAIVWLARLTPAGA